MAGPKYVKDFEFPTKAGFSGSATDRSTVPVRGYERRRFAEGGAVRKNRPLTKTEREAIIRENVGDTPRELKRSSGKGGNLVPPAKKLKGRSKREMERLELARGGQVVGNNRGLISRNPPTTEEESGTSPLRRGYKKGGLSEACKPMKRAMGGPVKAAKGGDVKQDKALINQAMATHIRSPRPAGHGVKGGKGSFQRTPLVKG